MTDSYRAPDLDRERELEANRLAVLQSYGILNTEEEPAFDAIAQTATEFGRSPAALIGFFDRDVQWFKSAIGWKLTSVPRRNTLCTAAELSTDPVIILDTKADLRFISHPWVVSGPLIRFYASIPLVAPTGELLGSLAIFDRVPHSEDPRLSERLIRLRDLVMSLLELRRDTIADQLRASQAEDARLDLAESEERFRDLFDSMDDIIVTIAPDGRVLHGNRTWLTSSAKSAPAATSAT